MVLALQQQDGGVRLVRACIISFTFLLLSLHAHAVMVATVRGFENDITADGRKVHLIVAGYGGDMGALTYEMAVSRAKKLKRDFPNERVVIIGSTPQSDGPTSRFSPSELEKKYDISLGYRGSDSFKNLVNDQRPLTADYFPGVVLNLLTRPEDREAYKNRVAQSGGGYNSTILRKAISSGEIPLASPIASLDFMTHSTPTSGIFLHDSNNHFEPMNNEKLGSSNFLSKVGLAVDESGKISVVDRELALRTFVSSSNARLGPDNLFIDNQGKPTDMTITLKQKVKDSQGRETGEEKTRKYIINSDGQLFRLNDLKEGSSSRTLNANSTNISFLNGLFSQNAYVNFSGCSGGYGMTEDLSKVLGVPVNGAATGSLVEVMDKNGDFFYNYPASNPYGDGELSGSKHASRGHELSASGSRAVVGLKVDQRLYHGYWGVLKSGTNFITSSCQIRSTEPQASEDRKRCEMGMARSMEDSLTETTVARSSTNLSFDDFTNVLIERMCPGGHSQRGYISESSIEVDELNSLKQGCVGAVKSLAYLNQYCSQNNTSQLFNGEVVGTSAECQAESRNFINKHRYYVPLTDRLGKTLFCTLENGCEVKLKGCTPTEAETRECLSANPDEESDAYKNCMILKRCEIDESQTRASNSGNPTFMKFIQNYMNGYKHLKAYRSGQLNFVTRTPGPMSVESRTVELNNSNSTPLNSQIRSLVEGIY